MTAAGEEHPATGVDTVLRHGHIITMDPDRRILVDGSIAIGNGRIVAIGPDDEVTVPDGVAERDLQGALVHPGFVDAHVHVNSQELIRGFAPKDTADWSDLELALWDVRSPEMDHFGTLISSMEMVANGTTMFADTGSAFWLEDEVRALEMVGIRGFPGHFLIDGNLEIDAEELQDPRFGSMPQSEIDILGVTTPVALERLQRQIEDHPFHSERRVRGVVNMFGSGRNTDELLVRARELASEHRVPMIMHQSWGPEEVSASLDEHGKRPLEHLADLGILGPGLTLVHMIHLHDRELELTIESGTHVVHCPTASVRRGMGALRMGRFPEMVRAGMTVALGSDGVSARRDVGRQMYLAAVGFREVRNEMPVFTGETILEMATLHGAAAVGMADEIGSLEVGKRADIVIHSLDRPEAHPRFQDPVDSLVFYRQSRTVDTVIIDGEAVYDGGRFTRFDAAEAYRQIDAAASRFENKVGPGSFTTWPIVG